MFLGSYMLEGGTKGFPPFKGGGRKKLYPVLRGVQKVWTRDFPIL